MVPRTVGSFFDKVGNTLNVWFDDPKKEHISEETSEEVVLVKDKNGKLIGFEVLNYLSPQDLCCPARPRG